MQEPTLREFFTRSGALARGTGFLARVLVAWPESTQGCRPFTEAPPNWPHLAAFHWRIAAILADPVPMDEDGVLSPVLLSLAPDARGMDRISRCDRERACQRRRALRRAGRSEQSPPITRRVLHGMGGAVGLDCFESASRVPVWHLNESRRFFGEHG
jgi:putative DNA primase/helicase